MYYHCCEAEFIKCCPFTSDFGNFSSLFPWQQGLFDLHWKKYVYRKEIYHIEKKFIHMIKMQLVTNNMSANKNFL